MDYKQFSTDSDCVYLRLNVDVPWQDLWREAEPHRDSCVNKDYGTDQGTKTSEGWSAGSLHGHGFDQINSRHSYEQPLRGLDTGYRWTPWVESECPITVDYFKHQFTPHTQYRRVRWMWLAPGGWIAPHVDDDQRCVDINIAVNNPNNCTFEYDDQNIPFAPGMAFILATHYRHAVYNRSDQWRLHIQINPGKDHTPWLDDVIGESWDRYHNTIYRSDQ